MRTLESASLHVHGFHLPAFVLLCACVRYWPYCGVVGVCFSAEIGTNYMGQGGPISHLALFAEVAAAKLL